MFSSENREHTVCGANRGTFVATLRTDDVVRYLTGASELLVHVAAVSDDSLAQARELLEVAVARIAAH